MRSGANRFTDNKSGIIFGLNLQKFSEQLYVRKQLIPGFKTLIFAFNSKDKQEIRLTLTQIILRKFVKCDLLVIVLFLYSFSLYCILTLTRVSRKAARSLTYLTISR